MDSAAPLSTAGPFSLLETMRLEHGGVKRLERHLARMAEGARRFGYLWDEAAVRRALVAVAHEHPESTWRLRLLLSAEGAPSVECTPYVPEARGPWRVAFAQEPIEREDPFILNKTTHRVVHDTARRSRPDLDEVLLWNRRGEATECTIGNIVVELDGRRWTPPVTSGLLAGTFRGELLDDGIIAERVLTKDDVQGAPRLWLINSVREWVEAVLVK